MITAQYWQIPTITVRWGSRVTLIGKITPMLACDWSGLAWCSPLATCDGNIAAPVMSTEQIIPKLEHVTIQSLVILDDTPILLILVMDRQRGGAPPLTPHVCVLHCCMISVYLGNNLGFE